MLVTILARIFTRLPGPNELSIADVDGVMKVLGANGLPKGECMRLFFVFVFIVLTLLPFISSLRRTLRSTFAQQHRQSQRRRTR